MERNLQRSSNFELLRIWSMMAIVSGHFMQSCAFGNSRGIILGFSYALGSGLCIAVNLFVMTGAWFMIEHDFKFSRVLRVYCQALFYSWIFLILELMFVPNISLGEKLRNLEPFFGFQYWFVTDYIMLLLLAPYLKKAFLMPRSVLVWLLVMLGSFICVFSMYPSGNNNIITNFMWFTFLFLFVGFVKGELLRHSPSWGALMGRIGLAVGLVIYAFLVICRWIGDVSHVSAVRFIGEMARTYIYNIQSLPNFLCSFGIFLWFATLKLGHCPLVNRLAKNAFGVYLIHCPFFNHFFWVVSGTVGFMKGDMFPIYALTFVVITYLACVSIDTFRARFVDPLLVSCRFLNTICKKIENFYTSFV